jgi:hypothetical protein
VLERPRRRWRTRRARRRHAGRRAAALLRRLQLSLAMLRTRLGDHDDPDLAGQRQRIMQTCQALQAAVAASSRGSGTA